jgi:hypothetical protein
MRKPTRAPAGFVAALLLSGCASSAVRVRAPADLDMIPTDGVFTQNPGFHR